MSIQSRLLKARTFARSQRGTLVPESGRSLPTPSLRSARGKRVGAPGKRKKLRDERGIALLMVIGAIVVLTVMLAEFQEDTGAEVAAATASRDALQAEYMARSAVNLSRLLIATEPTIRAAIAPLFMLLKRNPPQIPVWEFSDRILGAFNGADQGAAFRDTLGIGGNEGKNLQMPDGHFELEIVDEDSKINVNQGSSNDIARIRLGKEIFGLIGMPQYDSLFSLADAEGQFTDRKQLCQAVIDWADVDDTAFVCDFSATAQSAGAEDSFYSNLKKPVRRKNAPFDSLEELRMVRGVSDDFWAAFVDPEPEKPKKRAFTVWGSGAVNVNTANPQTLHAMVCSGAPEAELCTDASQASMFVMGFTMAKGISMGAPLFGAATDFVQAMTGKGQIGPILAGLGLKPVKFKSEAEFAKTISAESKVFSIYAVGVKKGYKRETRVKVHSVVDFRTAPALGSALATATAALAGAGANAGGTGGNTAAGAAALQAAVLAKPSTGGQVIYFRVQ
jgi:general secretion pathway protein K